MAREEALRAGENIKELTVRGIILGALITVIFTAANVYVGPQDRAHVRDLDSGRGRSRWRC